MATAAETSRNVNMNEFIRTRVNLDRAQIEHMVTHHNVVRNYKRLTKAGHDKTEALEESLNEVFCGGMTRDLRVYKTLATEANVKAIEDYIAGKKTEPTEEELNVPDLLDLKPMLRHAEDIAHLSSLLMAERAGKNAEGKPRGGVIKLLSSKIRELATPESEKPKASKADVSDLTKDD
tara:strand:+ start:2245 stop:2778 length:534 start_codon:yes stop_codon:yes gene_type:complete